jgi:non-heme chloroperoxidase
MAGIGVSTVEENPVPYITIGEENSGPIDLYYEDHGSGPPVVLIHGFPLSGAAWEKQVSALLAAGYRTITYDRRGFGRSSQPASGYDYDVFAADLNQIMTMLDLEDAVLVGHSMGTGEVTRYLSTYGSNRVRKAVFVSPIPPFLLKTSDNPEGIDKGMFDGFVQSIKNDRPAYQTQFLKDFFNSDQNLGKRVSQEAIQANWNIAVSASPVGTAACVPAWLTDFRDDLPQIDVPSLIIQGDADRVLPFPITGKRMATAVADSRLVVLEGAPHGIPWTHADEINNELMTFLK